MVFDVNSTHSLNNISLNKNLILSIIRSIVESSKNSDFPVVFCSCSVDSKNFNAQFNSEEDIRKHLSNNMNIQYCRLYFRNPQKSLMNYEDTHSFFVFIEYKYYNSPPLYELRVSAHSKNLIKSEEMLETLICWLAACLPFDTQSDNEHDSSSEQIVVSSENKTANKYVDSLTQITINSPSILIDIKDIAENKPAPKRKVFLFGTLQAVIIEAVKALIGWFLPK